MSGTLLIRADAGEGIGTGHVMRSLALAQAWQEAGGRAIFLSHCPGTALAARICAAGVAFEPLGARHPDSGDLAAYAARSTQYAVRSTQHSASRTRHSSLITHHSPADQSPAWVVLDGYHFDADYQATALSIGCRLLVIDDLAHLPQYHADLVLNQNLDTERLRYACGERASLLLGPRYALLRPEFRRHEHLADGAGRQIPETARKVLVTFGGEDPENVTALVLPALEQLGPLRLEARVVAGPANPHLDALRAAIRQSSANIRLLSDVADMPALIAWADVALTAAGATCWELAFMQVPALAVVLAENQKVLAGPLAEKGAVVNLGWHRQLTAETLAHALGELCRDRARRAAMAEAGRTLVDGRGAERVVKIMRALDGPLREDDLALRPMTDDDLLPVWRLANAPSVRLNSVCSDPIPLASHVAWFRRKLASPGTRMWALDLHGLVVGQVRYDRTSANTAEISVSVALPFRGRGLGTMLVQRTRQSAGRQLGVSRLRAVVVRGNAASARLFLKSGFTEVTSQPIRSKPCLVFEQNL